MNQELLTHIHQELRLPEKDLVEFLSQFKPVYLKKGEYFILEGQRKKNLGLIVKGCMYCYYNKDGAQVVDEFSMDFEFITDYYSYLTGSPAEKNVKCIENTELLVLPMEKLKEVYWESADFEKIRRLIAERLFINWHEKAMSLMLDDAATRYRKLVAKRPDLINRVPQYLIASYLNVTPETLSRIRNKIAQK